MTTEQLERFKRYGIPIDDGLIRLAQIGEENKAKMQAAAERREAEKAKANVSGNEQKSDTSGYIIDFAPTSKFVIFDTVKHTNFVIKYTNAYKSYYEKYDKESEKLLNQYLYIKINGKTYKTNSVATVFGRDFGGAFVGRFQGVFEIDNYLEIIIAHSLYVFDYFCSSKIKEECVLGNSVGKYKSGHTVLLDYKFELYKILQDWGLKVNDLVAIDGVAYNANEIGNYIWGMVLTYNGVVISPNLIAQLATQVDSWFKRNDEPWEQRAITKGKEKASKLRLNKDEIDQRFKEFIFFYNDEWIKLYPFDDEKL